MEESKEHSKNLKAEVIHPLGLLNYQEGSVVSRTLVNENGGSVTLFAFDEGEGLSEHTAPYDALVQLLEGEAEISVSGKAHRLKEGGMIIMPAGEPHSLKAVKKFKMVLTMIKT